MPQVEGVARRQAGAIQSTVKVVSPGITLRFSTAPVEVAGVTDGEASEAGPVPAEFVAFTVIVYGVPRDSPVIVQGLELQVPVAPPGEAVAV